MPLNFLNNGIFPDNAKLYLGTGEDLRLQHDGTDSLIDNYTGHLYIRQQADDKNIIFQADDGSGGVETYFYLDGLGGGSAPFTVWPDAAVIAMGSNHDTYIQHTGAHMKIDNYTGNFEISNQADDGDLSLRSDNGSGGSKTYLKLDGGIVSMIGYTDLLFGDDLKLKFGDSQDLEIYHDGSHSRIDETGTGGLIIRTGDFYLRNPSDEEIIYATSGGAVNLYYDNSKKFETTTNGATITGGLTTTASSTIAGANATADFLFLDNVKASFGTSGDLEIFHDAANSYINEVGTGTLYIQSEEQIRLGNSVSGEKFARFYNNAQVELFYDNVIKIETTSAGATVTGDLTVSGAIIPGSLSGYLPLTGGTMTGDIVFNDSVKARFGTGLDAYIQHDGTNTEIINATGNLNIKSTATDGDISFYADDGNGGVTEYFKLDGSSADGTYTYTKWGDNDVVTFGDGVDLRIYHEGTDSIIQNYTGSIYVDNNADDQDIVFRCDDGSGGLETYFFLDGSSSKTVFPDSKQLQFGSGGGESFIYSDGSDTYFQANNGNLWFYQGADDSNIKFSCDDGSGGVTEYFRIDGQYEVNRFLKNARFNDSVKANFGTGDDLQIYHDATDSLINNNTGHLYLTNYADNKDIYFRSDDGSGGVAVYFYVGGTAEQTIFVKNTEHQDGTKAQFGNAGDMQMYHDGSDSYIINGTGAFYIMQSQNDGNMVFQCDDGSGGNATYFSLDGGSSATNELYTKWPDYSRIALGSGKDLKIYHDSSNSNIVNETGNLLIEQKADDGDIIFYSDDGAGNVTQYFRVDGGAGETWFSRNTRYLDSVKAQFGTNVDLTIHHDGSNSYISETGTGNLFIEATNTIYFRNAAQTEYYGQFNVDGACNLRFNNSIKFETTTTGIEVTGLTDTDSLLIGSGATVTTILDEDNMASDSATALATQQSIKAYVDNSTTGVLTYQGTWNADTNSPTLSSGSGTPGYYYIVSVAGTTDLDGITDWAVGDWAVFSDLATDAWQKIDNSSVGNVTTTGGSSNKIVLWNGTNTIDYDSDFYVDGDTIFTVNLEATTKVVTPKIEASSALTIDAGGQLNLDSGNSEIHLRGSGTTFGKLFVSGSDFYINNPNDNEDIIFSGLDDSSSVNALTLDMSDAGFATFNSGITAGAGLYIPDYIYHVGDTHTYFGFSGNDAWAIVLEGTTRLSVADSADPVFTMNAHLNMSSKDIDYVSQLHFADNVRWKDNGNDSDLNFRYGDTTFGHLRFVDGNDAFQGGIYAESGYFGTLSPDGSWAVQSSNSQTNITHQLDVQGNIHLADSTYATYGGTNTAWELEIGVVGDDAYIVKSSTTSGNLYIKNNGSNKGIIFQNGGATALTIDSSQDATFTGAVSLTGGALSISGDGSNAVTFTESGSGDFTIDAPDDIRLDAGGGDIVLRDDGTEYGRLSNNNPGLKISSSVTNSSINLIPDGTGNVYAYTDSVIIAGDEAEPTQLMFRTDQGDDNGDDWIIKNPLDNILEFTNNISGSQVEHFSITPAATVADSIATFAGKVLIPSGYVGRDTHNYITFETDDQIVIRVADSHRLKLTSAAMLPYTDSSYDLGSTALRYSNIWVDNINGGTPTTGGPYLPLSGGTVSGNVAVTGTTTVGSSTGNGAVLHGSKAVTLTENTFTTTLTVTLSSHTACYVKIFVTGDWNSHSAVQYLGEYFLANSDGSYNEPGMIIREVDNTKTDSIVGKIVDPSGTSGNRDFVIQLKADDTVGSNNVAAKITYEVMGQYVSVS